MLGVCVYVRLRPSREEEAGDPIIVRRSHDKCHLQLKGKYETRSFEFDRVFLPSSGPRAIYSESVSPLVNTTFAGGTACVLAYGPRGTGKTHTLFGCLDAPREEAAIIPAVLYDVWDKCVPGRAFSARMSFLRITNDVLEDVFSCSGLCPGVVRLLESHGVTRLTSKCEVTVTSPRAAIDILRLIAPVPGSHSILTLSFQAGDDKVGPQIACVLVCLTSLPSMLWASLRIRSRVKSRLWIWRAAQGLPLWRRGRYGTGTAGHPKTYSHWVECFEHFLSASDAYLSANAL